MKALLSCRFRSSSCLASLNSKRDADPSADAAQNAAAAAKLAVRTLAQQFRPDSVDKTDQTVARLLEAPILYVESLTKNAGFAAVNSGGGQLCSEMRSCQ